MRYEQLAKMSQYDLYLLAIAYDKYIYNNGEMWDCDRQPIGVLEFYNNEYWEDINND